MNTAKPRITFTNTASEVDKMYSLIKHLAAHKKGADLAQLQQCLFEMSNSIEVQLWDMKRR
jgi:hypothetical protein